MSSPPLLFNSHVSTPNAPLLNTGDAPIVRKEMALHLHAIPYQNFNITWCTINEQQKLPNATLTCSRMRALMTFNLILPRNKMQQRHQASRNNMMVVSINLLRLLCVLIAKKRARVLDQILPSQPSSYRSTAKTPPVLKACSGTAPHAKQFL